MSNIRTSVSQLIGHTPLLELANIEKNDNLSAAFLPNWRDSILQVPPRTGWALP